MTSVADARPAPRARVAALLRWRLLHQLSWGVADQAVSSLASFAISVAAAHSLSAGQFGIFGLVFVTYGFAVTVSRGLSTDPLLVRHSGAPVARWRRAVSDAGGTALVVGAVGLLLCLGAGALIGASRTALIALGLTLPGLLLQDAWRFSFFAVERGISALANDLVWTVSLGPAVVLLRALHVDSAAGWTLAWGGTGCLAAAVGLAQTRVLPRPGRVRRWLHETRTLSFRYFAENLVSGLSRQLRLSAVAGLVALAAVGQIRAAELLLGPFTVVLMGVSMVAVPQASKVLQARPDRLARFCAALGGTQAVLALLWSAVMYVALPHGVGNLLLGSLWHSARTLLLPCTLSVAFACVSSGATSGLRALGAAPLSLRAQLASSTLYVILGIAGAVVGGALGTSWGVTAATAAGAVITWIALHAAATG